MVSIRARGAQPFFFFFFFFYKNFAVHARYVASHPPVIIIVGAAPVFCLYIYIYILHLEVWSKSNHEWLPMHARTRSIGPWRNGGRGEGAYSQPAE